MYPAFCVCFCVGLFKLDLDTSNLKKKGNQILDCLVSFTCSKGKRKPENVMALVSFGCRKQKQLCHKRLSEHKWKFEMCRVLPNRKEMC